MVHSDQISCSVVSDSLQPHELQHARPPCPSPTPRVHSDLHPLSQWCHPVIPSSVIPFSSCPQSLPASESFPMSQLFAWHCLRLGLFTGKFSLSLFFFLSLALPQFGLLSHVNSLRLPSGHSGSVLALSNAAGASLFSPQLLVVAASGWLLLHWELPLGT